MASLGTMSTCRQHVCFYIRCTCQRFESNLVNQSSYAAEGLHIGDVVTPLMNYPAKIFMDPPKLKRRIRDVGRMTKVSHIKASDESPFMFLVSVIRSSGLLPLPNPSCSHRSFTTALYETFHLVYIFKCQVRTGIDTTRKLLRQTRSFDDELPSKLGRKLYLNRARLLLWTSISHLFDLLSPSRPFAIALSKLASSMSGLQDCRTVARHITPAVILLRLFMRKRQLLRVATYLSLCVCTPGNFLVPRLASLVINSLSMPGILHMPSPCSKINPRYVAARNGLSDD